MQREPAGDGGGSASPSGATSALHTGAGAFDGILAALPHDAVIVLDPQLKIVWSDRDALISTGMLMDGSSFTTVDTALLPEVADAIRAGADEALQGRVSRTDVRLHGRTYSQSVTVVAGEDRDGPASGLLVLWEDVTQARSVEAGRREAELQLRLTVDNAPIGEAIVELDGRWRAVNPALVRLLHYSEEALLQTTFQDITHPDDLELDLDLLQQLVSGEIESYQMEKRYFTATGGTVWALLCVSLVRNEAAEPLYFVSQILDITHRKEREWALRDLTSMLAHDLRLPTTIISGYAELLLTEDQSFTETERRGVVTRLARATSVLEALLENSLTASSLDAQGITPAPAAVEVHRVAGQVVVDVPHAGVEVDLTAGHPVMGWIDPLHLERVLTNLVTNAVKYGGERVSLTVDQVEDRIVVHVIDRGPGVRPDFAPRLFERFSRSDTARAGKQLGSGLGLHIVRDLMRLNSGTVAYAPTPGGGATFSLTFPAAHSPEKPARADGR